MREKMNRRDFVKLTGIATVCLAVIIFWGIKTFSPPASEPAFVEGVTSEQEASDLLKKEMLEIADELIGEFPADERLRTLAVKAHLACLNYTQARVLLEEGIGLNPRHGDFYQRLADIASHHGQYDEAVTYWKKALEISPERTELKIAIAEAILSSGRYRQAVEELEEYIKTSAGSVHVYYLLGQGYLQLKEYDKSKKYFEKALEIRPSYSNANYGLAIVYMRLKQRDKAQHYMKLFRDPKAERLSYKSDIARKRDKLVMYDNSAAKLEAFPELFAELCIKGGKLYTKNRKLDKALTLFNKGENTFARVVRIVPEVSEIYREFAFFYLVMNSKLDETVGLAERAVALEGSAKNYYVLFSALYRNHDDSGAHKALKKAIELDPDNLKYRNAFDETGRSK